MADKQIDRLGREVVRVKQKKTGHEFTRTVEWAKRYSDGYDVLDKPAVAADGERLPAKTKTTVAQAAAKKTTASSTTKEN